MSHRPVFTVQCNRPVPVTVAEPIRDSPQPTITSVLVHSDLAQQCVDVVLFETRAFEARDQFHRHVGGVWIQIDEAKGFEFWG